MSHLSNLPHLLKHLLPYHQTTPDPSLVRRNGFDSLRLETGRLTPKALPALFNARERRLGDPAHLFQKRLEKTRKRVELGRVKGQWLDVLKGLDPYGLRGQIAGINTYLNRSSDTPVLAHMGQSRASDAMWTAPLRVFHNAGSEHVAYAKYLSLRHIGINAERLRLVWVEDTRDHTSRVVLAATFVGRNYIFDNHQTDIIEDQALPHFKPYCSTSSTQFSLHWQGEDDAGWEASLKQLGDHVLH